jgi:TM2 domain-containing membrane protein YozV
MNTPDQNVQEIREETDQRVQERPRPAPPEPYAEWTRKTSYYPEDPRRKSPVLASVMSAMPGLGQIYVGYYQQGFANILVVGTVIALLNSSHRIGLRPLEPLLGLFLAFFWLYNIVDAGRRAAHYNHALAGLEPGALPEEIALPKGPGSLAGGVVLIIFGFVVFSNTMFGWSLEWVGRWWPLAVVAAGAWLVYQSMAAKRK